MSSGFLSALGGFEQIDHAIMLPFSRASCNSTAGETYRYLSSAGTRTLISKRMSVTVFRWQKFTSTGLQCLPVGYDTGW